jgi:molecular chaperone DnaK
VTIHVLQGEREFARDNRTLGRFDLSDIPPAPRGVPQIEVEFAIDANGILNVAATDKASKKTQKIEIKGSSGLSKSEIDKMKKDAEAHSAEDKARRDLVDTKNKADAMLYATRRSLEQHGGKVSAEVRGGVEGALSNLESVLKGEDKGAIEKAIAELERVSMELGRVMYEAAKAAGAPAGAGGAENSGGGANSDVIDAEYEVKDDGARN